MVTDATLEQTNRALHAVANAITPIDAGVTQDESGGFVASMTEATMGMTAGLFAIARALDNLADAVRESKSNE